MYLKEYDDLYRKDPRKANMEWFRRAKYGLFLHYGLYSLLGRHEWVQYREKIPVAEYAKLMDSFTAEKFDADKITEFAATCGMKYINITTRHHESFCLWDSRTSSFNSMNSPAKRDLVREIAVACEKRGLGLFLYYSHGRDWRHPHAPNNDKWGGYARPAYNPPESAYKYNEEHDLKIYLQFIKDQITELLMNFPTVAGIWLDGIAVPLNGPTEEFCIPELYDHIRSLSPHALVSYKQGVTGTEDFFAPEHIVPAAEDNEKKRGCMGSLEKLVEVCTTMIDEPCSWGYWRGGRHKTAIQVVAEVEKAINSGVNLLLNTGPLPDGSLDPEDMSALQEASRILKEKRLI
jgi:alpha-L-fucosidase